MTLPDERRRAILYTKDFLLALCNPRATPRVPKKVREEARSLLKHYPISENELDLIGEQEMHPGGTLSGGQE